jgi:hypothetical protein
MMHPPSDPVRRYLFEFRYWELLREAERMRLADQVPQQSVLARLRTALAPHVTTLRRRYSPQRVVPPALGAPSPDRAIEV